MSRISIVAIAVVASASVAFATGPRDVKPVDPATIHVFRAENWAPLDENGHIIGGLRPIPQNNSRAASWKMAFDSMNTNPITQLTYSGQYGTTTAYQIADAGYKCYMWANDITALNTGTALGHAKMARLAFYWNPDGNAASPSGALNFAAKISTGSNFDNTSDGPVLKNETSSIMITRANLDVFVTGQGNRPNKEVFFDMSTVAASLPLPAVASLTNSGVVKVELGTYDSGTGEFQQFNPLVICAPLFSNQLSVGEPTPAGTNPSKSGELMWLDDGSTAAIGEPDYVFQDFTNTSSESFPFAELYSGDYTTASPSRGMLQPAVALFVDQNMKQITGTVVFNSLAVPANRPGTAKFTVYNSSTNALLSTQILPLSSTGGFVLADPNPSTGGSYRIKVEESTWLRKASGIINTASGVSVPAGTLSLINGDVDDDGEIGSADFDIVVANFGVSPANPGDGDVDRDDEVGSSDFDIVVANFGLGDE